MGLDISAYSSIKEVTDIENYDIDTLDVFYYSGNNNNFLVHLGELKTDTYYKICSNSEYFNFRFGSYGSYNTWRNQLAIMMNYGSAENIWCNFNNSLRCYKLKKLQNKDFVFKPFYLLIYFSDCEGVIPSNICKKLYLDFVDFDEKAKEQHEYFYKKYCDLKEAFRIASENGFVRFR